MGVDKVAPHHLARRVRAAGVHPPPWTLTPPRVPPRVSVLWGNGLAAKCSSRASHFPSPGSVQAAPSGFRVCLSDSPN